MTYQQCYIDTIG